jgi:hypothetical protein
MKNSNTPCFGMVSMQKYAEYGKKKSKEICRICKKIWELSFEYGE